jgi:ABC-type nitrate/sulfonate/bicarbonate transport system substrate-binding protein
MTHKTHATRGLVASLLGLTLAGATASHAIANPVKIRIGRGAAAEEQLWLLKAMPQIAPNEGKVYTIEMTRFRGTDQRFQAFEAGALDAATGSANSVIFAAAQGLKMTVVASLCMESKKGFVTHYMVRANSNIHSVKDLKGKVIGVNGLRSSIHMWAYIAVQKAGLDPNKDVRYAPVRFPAHYAALRAGKIDVGAFPNPFYHIAMTKGGVRTLFTSKDAVPFDEELMLMVFRPAFIKAHPKVVRAFLSDLVGATKYYVAHRKKAQQAIINAKITRIPPKVYFQMKDYYRAPNGRVDIAALKKMQDLQIKVGFQKKKADIDKLVDLSYLPK